MATLKLEDFSDRELLFALTDHADPDGLVSSQLLAEALGIDGLKSPTQSVAIRLSWLKRYGVVRRCEETKRWGLTEIGDNILHARLTARERKLLEELDAEKLLMVTARVGQSIVGASSEVATMAARDMRYHQAARKRRWAAA